MTTAHTKTNRLVALGVTALVLLLVAAFLPALGIAAVVLRVVLLLAAFAALAAGLITYLVSPGFRWWVGSQLDLVRTYKGLRLRDGIALSDGHTWVLPRRDDVVVGVDDLAQRALGPIDAVDLPPDGSRVRRGHGLLTLHHGDRALRVKAPISGRVLHHNRKLEREPACVNENPYGCGWALVLRGDRPDENTRLRTGWEAEAWFDTEVDRLLLTIQPSPVAAASMVDGGVLVPEFHRAIDPGTWDRIQETFFEFVDEGAES